MEYTLTNGIITIGVSSKGAELKSLVCEGKEYMWQADPKYWGRTAPVLFPMVGSLKEKKYQCDGKEYQMGQHGFARDMEFEVINQTKDSITLRLSDNAQTKEKYPFDFELEITHSIWGRSVRTTWRVSNPSVKPLYFSIGGHPAFQCEMEGYEYHLYEDAAPAKELTYRLLSGDGIVMPETYTRKLSAKGGLEILPELFEKDALIVTDSKVRKVALADPTGKEYLTVQYDQDTTIFGLWSPAGKAAPFVCIEPWYGTADWSTDTGNWKEKKYMRRLDPAEVFERGYTIFV